MIPQPAAAGHVTVYVQPYGVDLQVQGVMVAGEEGGMDIRGLKDDVQPEGVAAVLLDKDRQILALSSNFVAGADGVARGSMDCSTEEIGAIFAFLDGMAVREFSLCLWDATGGHLVGVGRAQMRNNPLLPDVWESWTNVTVLASNEWRMAVAGLQAEIDANAAAIAALQGASSTNASGVAGLWAAVATNAAGIEALRGATGTNAAAIAELRGTTATNASGIASLWEALVATSNAIPSVVDWSARWVSNDLEHASLRAATNLLHGSVAANTAEIASLWEALVATSNAIPSVVDWSSRWESNDLEHASFRSATNWLRNSMSNNSVRLGTLQTNLQLASNVFPLVWAAILSNRTEVANAIYGVWQGVFAASNAIPSLDGMASEEWVEDYVAEHAPDWDPPTNMASKVYVDEVVWGLSHLIPAITTTNPAVATSNILAFAAAIAELQEQAEAAGVSIEELEESVAAVVSTNAYTLAVLAALRQQVSSHVADTDNPHGVTLAQLDEDGELEDLLDEKYGINADEGDGVASISGYNHSISMEEGLIEGEFNFSDRPTYDGHGLARTNELGFYVAKTNGAWVVVQEPLRHALLLNGQPVFAALAEEDADAIITGVCPDGEGNVVLSFLGGEDTILEAAPDLEEGMWEEWTEAEWDMDGETFAGTVTAIGGDDGTNRFFRIVVLSDVPTRTNAWLQAGVPLYLDGARSPANRAASRGDVEAASREFEGRLSGYAKLEEMVPSSDMTPGEDEIAWQLSTTGSTFNAVTLGGVRRDAWPDFRTGGPLYPCFVQATRLLNNLVTQYIPDGPEESLGNIFAVPLSREFAVVLDTTKSSWTNLRSSVVGAEPGWADTETMVWSEGDPFGWGIGTATGFWWKVAGPCTGSWGVALGTYTGETAAVKSFPTIAPSNCWGWTRDAPGSLREKANADLDALAARPGRGGNPWTGSNGIWQPNTNFWAAEMDLSCSAQIYMATDGLHNARVTAVTRRHVLTANHARPPLNAPFRFFDGDANMFERSVTNFVRIGDTDIALGMLDADLPASIQPARILRTNDWPKLLAQKPEGKNWSVVGPSGDSSAAQCASRGAKLDAVTVLNLYARLMWINAEAIGTADALSVYTNAASAYCNWTGRWSEKAFVMGDSGTPVFLWLDGQTVLAMTIHTGNVPHVGGGPNISKFATAIEKKIREWGGTTETNLYWCDLENWPLPTAGNEESEE